MIVDLQDEKVCQAVETLERAGCSISLLQSSTKEHIVEVLGRSHPSEILVLVNAAHLREEALVLEDLYAKHFQFVGRVEAHWEGEQRIGTCILVGGNGLSLTAFHIVAPLKRRGKGNQKSVNASSIQVTYPCMKTKKGNAIRFNAIIAKGDVGNDLALLLPNIHKKFQDIPHLSAWSPLTPLQGEKVLTLSYPSLLDKELPSLQRREDKPRATEGIVVAVTMRRVVSTCTTMAGSSGGLVLSAKSYGGAFALGVHISSLYDYERVTGWTLEGIENLNQNFTKRGEFELATRTGDMIIHGFRTCGSSKAIQIPAEAQGVPQATKRTSKGPNRKKRKQPTSSSSEINSTGIGITTDSKEFTLSNVGCIKASVSKVVSCHFSSDGKLLASAGHDKPVLWITDTCKTKSTLQTFSSSAFSSQRRKKGDTFLTTEVRFAWSSMQLATSSFDKTVRVWNVDEPSFSLRNFTGHQGSVMSLDYHPLNEDILCSCDAKNEIRYWSVLQGNCTRIFQGGSTQVRFQPRVGRFLAAAAENVVGIFDVDSETLVHSLQGHMKPIHSICWDATGDYVASVSEDSVCIWSLRNGDRIHELSYIGNKFHSCVFHPRYPHVLVIGCYQALELWSMQKKQTMTVSAHDGLIAALAQSPETGMVASASHDKYVKLWK